MIVRLDSPQGPQVLSPSETITKFAKETESRQTPCAVKRLSDNPDAFAEIDGHYRQGAGQLMAAVSARLPHNRPWRKRWKRSDKHRPSCCVRPGAFLTTPPVVRHGVNARNSGRPLAPGRGRPGLGRPRWRLRVGNVRAIHPAMSAAWKHDFPNVRHYYVFQIWPKPAARAAVTATCSAKRSGHCRPVFEFARHANGGDQAAGRVSLSADRLVENRAAAATADRTGLPASLRTSITPPNLKHARYASDTRDAIVLELTSRSYGVILSPASSTWTTVPRKSPPARLRERLKLKKTSSAARKITYLKEMNWSQDKLLLGGKRHCRVHVLRRADRLVAQKARARGASSLLAYTLGLRLLCSTSEFRASQQNVRRGDN